ncbi:MAG: PDZ domain-containing protein [Acidobacteriota bacterium]|nr:PDZ domain-containing protein [Acidobacteriota bacterium]
MRTRVGAAQLAGALVGLVVLAGIVLYLLPSNDYILLPDVAHPVAPLVRVQGAHPAKGPGGIYFVDVFERRASMLESLFPFIRSGATLVPAGEIVPPGSDAQQVRRADLREMSLSQRIAAAVALRRLGYKVKAAPDGVIVNIVEIGSHAIGKLQPTDVIVSANGRATPTIASLEHVLARFHPGATVVLGVERGGAKVSYRIRTIADPLDPRRAIIGFSPDQAANIELPIRVQIDAGNVGGPSAGLAFTLQVMEALGKNVDRGYRVAATGTIALDGSVGAIGGIEQKTIGVRRAHADVFLVPVAGDNAADAKRYAHGLRIIPVKSFPQALHALATLPQKRQ